VVINRDKTGGIDSEYIQVEVALLRNKILTFLFINPKRNIC